MISNFGVADGGRETWAYNFIPRLLERWPGVTLDIVGLNRAGEHDNKPRLAELLQGRGKVTFLRSERKRFPVLSMLRDAPRRLSGAKHPPPDVVIGVGSAVELLVIRASPAFRRARKIVWLRTILADEKARRLPKWLGRVLRTLEIPSLRSADLLIANGEDTAAYYRARGLKVAVIANGVDVQRWRCGSSPIGSPLRIAYVGRLIGEKGLVEFLTVAKRLHDGRQFEFHVVGEGPYAAEVRRAHDEGWVIHHGPKPNDEVPAALADFDVCVALSFKSGQGGGGGVSNALLEQMAAGRVILAWRNETYGQLLDDANAFLVPQGDVAALESVLKEIAADPEESRRRAEAAAGTAEGFSFEAHMDKFAALVEPLLARGR